MGNLKNSPEKPAYLDISPEISEESAVFPGDTPYRRRTALEFAKGDHLGLSRIETTVHIGAHADAPSHYHPDGKAISDRSLDYYFGPCQVVSAAAGPGKRLTESHLKGKLRAPRVLFKTGSHPDPKLWSEDFNSLSPRLVSMLAENGVVLVGIDTPSIDPPGSKLLESHRELFKRDMAVLEGLVLDHVPDGVYRLVALPLRLKGADASPVRAILLPK